MSIHPILAQLSAKSSFSDNWAELLSFQVTGLVLVMITLAALWGVIVFVGMLVRNFEHRMSRTTATPAPQHKERATVPAAVPSSPEPAACPVDPELVAVITAAAHAMLGGDFRIVSIAESPNTPPAWSAEGRRQIFSSHNPRNR